MYEGAKNAHFTLYFTDQQAGKMVMADHQEATLRVCHRDFDVNAADCPTYPN